MNITTPVGRMVQGSVDLQHQKDPDDNKTLLYEDAAGQRVAANMPGAKPVMGVFIALAFPKLLPGSGTPNTEFNAFYDTLKQLAAASWPALFPQGPLGACVNPKFSWKYQDGDGYDTNGKSVADKAGFAGHHILKFYSKFHVRCFNDGFFAAHEELQEPAKIIKRGYWVQIVGEAKSNGATGTQVPGISLYPSLLSFIAKGEEISSGPDAQEAFGARQQGWRPPVTESPIPGAPGTATLPTPPKVVIPAGPGAAVNVVIPPPPPPPPPKVPVLTIAPHWQAQGVTLDALRQQGWTDETIIAAGHAAMQ